MAFVVEMVPIFKFSISKAARVSFAFSCHSHFQAIKHFSTQEKEPSQRASPPGFGNEGNSHHHGSHHLPMSGLGDAARVMPKSHPPHKSYKDLARQKNLRWQWKSNMRSTEQAASSSEEFRNLREDDFSKERKRQVPKPTSIERTKGSEILFGIAPCSLALSQSKRDFFKLFLKSGSSCARPVMEEFAQRAKACGVPVHHVRRQVLDALCKGKVHQGVCLEATPLHFRSLEEAEASHVGVATGLGTQLIWLVLEQIQDPMNLGAVLRSAHFLGVDRVVTSQKDSEQSKRWSHGGFGSIQHRQSPEISEGNEGYGLSSETQSLCHRMLIIPPGRTLQPGIESLNVSVATGILLHSICSQKIK
ncbi:rRNA methyltransferase 1, mitochondrial isoform X2 [Chelonia mydas]|uniref:rRNA methyltransferase 1, mitochondrial isoform X2 n=1 Tax=Chelonia mydas TaxID=8469 RepID=UPI0018A23539|nr:rRNA methyltransferase 1, mitochondrial isoform X2 [Chelonia mydas]